MVEPVEVIVAHVLAAEPDQGVPVLLVVIGALGLLAVTAVGVMTYRARTGRVSSVPQAAAPVPPVEATRVPVERPPTPAFGSIKDEAWVKMQDERTIPISATEVLLVPLTLKTDADEVRRFVKSVNDDLQTSQGVLDRLPDNAMAIEAKDNSAAVVHDAQTYLGQESASPSALMAASKARYDYAAAECRTENAAFGRSASASFADKLLKTFANDPLWALLRREAIEEVRTDREGKFALDRVEPGVYAVVCRAPLENAHAIVQWSAEPVVVKADQTADVSFDPTNAMVTSY